MKKPLGEYIRDLREQSGLPLRKVASVLDIDPSTLSKIERGERSATKEMLMLLSGLFKIKHEDLNIIYLSDKVAYELLAEDNPQIILKAAEEKIKYLKAKNIEQGTLNL
jgi:transcriptional regulator with XRE-family HTH domain